MRISDWSSECALPSISYQSASKGVPVIMKDIADKALDLGMEEANKLLSKQVGKKLTAEKAGHILSTIRPTLNYGDFQTIDIVVEAVVENPKIKKSVLAEVERAEGRRVGEGCGSTCSLRWAADQ